MVKAVLSGTALIYVLLRRPIADKKSYSVARLVEAGVSAQTGDSPFNPTGEGLHHQQTESTKVEAVPAPHPTFEVANQLLQS